MNRCLRTCRGRFNLWLNSTTVDNLDPLCRNRFAAFVVAVVAAEERARLARHDASSCPLSVLTLASGTGFGAHDAYAWQAAWPQ